MVRIVVGAQVLSAIVLVLLFRCAPATAQQPAKQAEGKPPVLLEAKPLQPAAGDSKLQGLLKERYNAALEELQEDMKLVQQGRIIVDFLFDAQKRLLEAGLELKGRPADRLVALQDHLELAKRIEFETEAQFQAGTTSSAKVARARYFRLDLEIRLLREREAAARGKGP